MNAFQRARMERLLHESPFDAVVASSYANVRYLSGASIMTQRLIPGRLALVVWPRWAEPVLVVCGIEVSFTQAHSWIADQRTYEEFAVSPIQLLAEVLKQLGLHSARLGIEKHALTAQFYEELALSLPEAALLQADEFFERVRMVKSAAEIELLSRAARATDEAIASAWAEAGPGMSEKELANRMQQRLLSSGAENIAFLVLGAGDTARMAHPYPRERRLAAGDMVRVDFGGMFQGYYSDLARTGRVNGGDDSRAADIYARLWEVHNEVIAAVRPGVKAREVFESCRQAFERRGLTFRMPHIGHGLGLSLHEQPVLHGQNEIALEPGMVLAIEPIHYEPDGTRYHVEDLVVVHTERVEVVSRYGDWDELFTL